MEPQFLKIYGSDQIQKFLHDEIIKGKSDSDDLLQSGLNKLHESYEEMERSYSNKEDGINGTSDFFALGEDEDI